MRDERDLATVPPCDKESEDDMEAAEADGEKPSTPSGGSEDGDAAEKHEEESHDGDDGNGKGAAGHDSGAIEKEPGGWEGRLQTSAKQKKREERAGDEWRSQADGYFSGRAGEQRKSATVGFPCTGKKRDRDGQNRLSEPDAEPCEGRELASCKDGGSDSRDTQEDLSPAGDGRKGGGALHGVTDEAQVFGEIWI